MNLDQRDLEAHKRELLVRSEAYRQSLRSDVHQLVAATEWVPRTLSTLRYVSPALLLLVPAAAFAAGRWAISRGAGALATAARPRSTLLGKILMGVRFYQQIKPLWDNYTRAR